MDRPYRRPLTADGSAEDSRPKTALTGVNRRETARPRTCSDQRKRGSITRLSFPRHHRSSYTVIGWRGTRQCSRSQRKDNAVALHSLGYLHLGTPRLEEWRSIGRDVLGFMDAPGPVAEELYFRWDKYPYRLRMTSADEPGIVAVGFEVGDDHDLEEVAQSLVKAGHEVAFGSEGQARDKLVSGFARFTDSAGVRSRSSTDRSSITCRSELRWCRRS